MKLLVLGGSVFLSRAVAEAALAAGHDVTCACRGVSGTIPEGARHVWLDRADPDWSQLDGDQLDGEYDAVVDVARLPGQVRSAVAAFPAAHWVFVSTINVYADDATPGGTPDTLPLHQPIRTDEDASKNPETYGAMKVACEQIVRDGARSATVVRPGLIVGPGDPSGRFSYWPSRVAEAGDGGEVLAPGSPDDTVQVIDVRDLAAWLVHLAAERIAGVFDGTGHPTTRRAFLADVARGVDTHPAWTWVGQERLVELEVPPWAGEGSIPVWLPLPEYAGLMSHDVAASFAAGLTTRPLSDTARDTLAWLRATPDAPVTGMTRQQEAALLGRSDT